MAGEPTGQQWLRCSAFEELMLEQDSSDHPCVICLRVDLSVQLPSETVHSALQDLTLRHPMLRARLVPRWFKLWWRIEAQNPIVFCWHDEQAPRWPRLAQIDLCRQSGIQVDCYSPSESASHGTVLFLQMHHALIDGLGCTVLVEELLQLLAAHLGHSSSAASSPEKYSHSDLIGRSTLGLTWGKLFQLVPGQFVGLAGVRQFLMRRPVSIGNDQCSKESERLPRSVAACSIDLDREITEALKHYARGRQVTVNDLLASIVFESVYELHVAGGGRASDWLRMMVPISLREPNNSTQSAVCNLVGCIFLDRTGQQITDPSTLLSSVHQEMMLIKRHRLVWIFLFSLWIKKVIKLRGSIRDGRLAPKDPSCHTSFVFSNMARIFHDHGQLDGDGCLSVGSISLKQLRVLAPVGPLVNLAITAAQYAGKLTLCLRYDERYISHDQAESLSAQIESALVNLVLQGTQV